MITSNRRSRRHPLVVSVLALGAVLAVAAPVTACGGDDSAEAPSSTNMDAEGVPEPQPDDSVAPTGEIGTLVQSGESGESEILFDALGQSLYLYTLDADRPPGSPPTCFGDCATAWPPLLSTGTPTAGGGVDASLLGTVGRADGTQQVTYAGQPLYLFASDQPGTTSGQGVGGVWFLVSPSGQAVRAGS
ncbi:MAG: hypothetical protein ACKO5A_05415 [Actinomycetota bacterium]